MTELLTNKQTTTQDLDNQCPICNEEFELDDKITLTCNHSFCYECLLESYKGAKCNFSIQKTHRICPYCRTPADYLPLKKNSIPIKGIHREYGKKITKTINVTKCMGTTLKGTPCKFNAQKNCNYCMKHMPK